MSHCDSREADTGREKGFGTGAGCAGRYARKQGDKARSRIRQALLPRLRTQARHGGVYRRFWEGSLAGALLRAI